MRQLLVGIALAAICWIAPLHAAQYGVARRAAPVLNTPAFTTVFGGRHGNALKTDRCGQVRELEYIALPGTVFRLLEKINKGTATIYRVTTDDYPTPAGKRLYLDSRFIDTRDTEPLPRARMLPAREDIIASLKCAVGKPYVWGGNIGSGVAELTGFYYWGNLPPGSEKQFTLAGLDCSGLLYQATNGWTPRNTSQLVMFGKGLTIATKTAERIAALLEPLDLIVWNGHLIIVLDSKTVIESRLECGRPGHGGVVTTPLRQRLTEIMQSRSPVDAWPREGKQQDVFVVRRWFGL